MAEQIGIIGVDAGLVGTWEALLSRLQTLAWCPESIEEVRQAEMACDLLLLRGRHTIELFTVKAGMTIHRAAMMIRARKGNSRVRLYVTLRANNRL